MDNPWTTRWTTGTDNVVPPAGLWTSTGQPHSSVHSRSSTGSQALAGTTVRYPQFHSTYEDD